MAGKEGVALVVPEGFDSYARLLHPLEAGERWASVAPDYLRSGDEQPGYPFPDAVRQVEGDMGSALVDALVPVLAAGTTTPQDCHFGLWTGWGELHPGSHAVAYARQAGRFPLGVHRLRRRPHRVAQTRPGHAQARLYGFVDACAVQPWWGGRDMLLFDGPIEAVSTIGSPANIGGEIRRRGPQWWWPADRCWFVATEIDHPWTYVAGPAALVDAAVDVAPEAVRVKPSDRW